MSVARGHVALSHFVTLVRFRVSFQWVCGYGLHFRERGITSTCLCDSVMTERRSKERRLVLSK